MIENTIEKIKEAEEKAAQKLKEAAAQGKIIVGEAQKAAVKAKDDAACQVKEKAAELNHVLENQGKEQIAESLKAAGEEIKKLKDSAADKTEEVVDKIISKLV